MSPIAKENEMERVYKLVRKMAGRYARRCWWVERDDLIQTGYTAVLEAMWTWDSERGEFAPYAMWMANRDMREYLWSNSAPVSAPRGHRYERARGLFRAPLDAEAHQAPDGPEDLLQRAAIYREVMAAVERCDTWGALEATLLDGLSREATGRLLGVSPGTVRGMVLSARKRLCQDEGLWDFLAHDAIDA